MNEMIKKYMQMYDNMAASADPSKMHIFGEAEKWVFRKMVDKDPDMAKLWLEKLEPSCWHNYLTRDEANEIVEHLVNQDGMKGGKWDYDTFMSVVKQMGGMVEDKPYYNPCALWATANMLYSDHYESAKEFVPREQIPKYFYKMSVEKLKDVDHPHFIREYFDL